MPSDTPRLSLLIWGGLVVVLAPVALVVAVLTGLIDDYSEVAIFLAGVAAVGAVGSVIITAIGNATNSRQLRELAAQQEQATADIRRLAELTESSLEEARAQKPEPVVRFVVEKDRVATEAAIYRRKRFSRMIGASVSLLGGYGAASTAPIDVRSRARLITGVGSGYSTQYKPARREFCSPVAVLAGSVTDDGCLWAPRWFESGRARVNVVRGNRRRNPL